jgi:hypothetical protein
LQIIAITPQSARCRFENAPPSASCTSQHARDAGGIKIATVTQVYDGTHKRIYNITTKKRERFPTTVVEYQENEVRDLLALELPTKKKKMMNKGDTSTVHCFNCKELGHYANRCPEPKQPRGTDLVIC